MSYRACFNCGKYWPVTSTARHRVPGDHDKTYNYEFESDVPDKLEKEKPELKDFSASYYYAKDLLVYPLSALESQNFREIEVGDVLEDRVDISRAPDVIEVTGIVRHWDRIEIFFDEVEA